jgi:hypothetical protein
MLPKIPVSVCLFLTTKDRYAYRNFYRHTIDRLNQSIPLCNFGNLSAHIKISADNHISTFIEMENWLESKGFDVFSTHKIWDKVGNQHAEGYYQDMNTLLAQDCVHSNPYMLLLEDDWLINCDNLDKYFAEGIKLLRDNKDILCVRINDEMNKNASKAKKITRNIYTQTKDNTKFGETITFQPTLFRTRDWYAAVRLINKNWEQFKHQHCELVSGNVMKYLFSDKEEGCFAFFDPEKLNCTHIGTEEFAGNYG